MSETWYATKMANNHQGLIVSETTGENIAVSYKRENAPILAAALDLLKACKAVASNLDRRDGFDYLIHITEMKKVLAAIDKAEEEDNE